MNDQAPGLFSFPANHRHCLINGPLPILRHALPFRVPPLSRANVEQQDREHDGKQYPGQESDQHA